VQSGPYHADRARAESFGAVAAAYDRYRPAYPDELIAALAALRPAAVLDVGCGTGKAARQLAARGLDVLGVEIDPQMAELARAHGIDVEVASFEQWDDAGRRFDLIVSGQAWHWVDPAVGAPKLARLLRPGGTACLFWNFENFDDATKRILDAAYAQVAPELIGPQHSGPDDSHAEALQRTGCFASVRSERLAREEVLRVEDWIGRVSTYSKELLLGPQRLGQLQAMLRDALAAAGDTVRLASGTYVVWARP
jgi:SAM-dependent methyltransferase